MGIDMENWQIGVKNKGGANLVAKPNEQTSSKTNKACKGKKYLFSESYSYPKV